MSDHEVEYEYVDLLLDVQGSQIVSCEYFGEGRQTEPITEPIVLKPLDSSDIYPRSWNLMQRRIRAAFRKFSAQPVSKEE